MKRKFWKKKKIPTRKITSEVFAEFSLLISAVLAGILFRVNIEKITAYQEGGLLLIIFILLIVSVGLKNLK